ncbi:MAG: hypothetical protein WBN93_13790 [Acidimicrobiia bacterium]
MAEELIPAPSGTRLRLRTGEKGGVPTFLQLEVIGWTLKQSSDGRSVLVPMVWGYGSEKTGEADRLDDVVAHLAQSGVGVENYTLVSPDLGGEF